MEELPQKPPKRITKNRKDFLQEGFPAQYIKEGLNGTRAYKALKPSVKLSTARAEAPGILALPSVQKAISELLPSVEEELGIISKALSTPKPNKIDWKDTHKFVETRLKLRGLLKDKAQSTSNIAIIIEK